MRLPAILASFSLALTTLGFGTCDGLSDPDPRTSGVVGACADAVAAETGEQPARSFIAQQNGSVWTIDMWRAGNDAADARPDHTCVAVVGDDGQIVIESLR